MHLISGNTASEVVLRLYNTILDRGHYRPSRNGGCTTIFDVTLEMLNPRSRHLSLMGRKSNIFALIAETFWVLGGEENVAPYLSFFLPRAPDYSDDGKTWHGAYGPRMYRYDQLQDAIDSFKTDSLYTRRSFVTISDPLLDNQDNIQDTYGLDHKAKDIPCNREIHFYVEGEDQFCAKVIQRSGDAIFGTGSINPFEFSIVHELMYNEVEKSYPDLKLGPYRWHVTNAHLYDFSKSQAEAAINFTGNYGECQDESNHRIFGPSDFLMMKDFFADIVEVYTEAIESDDPRKTQALISNLGYSFISYDVPVENNLLWTYAQLVAHYIASKQNVELQSEMVISNLDEEFKRSILSSAFLKFDVE